MAWTKSLVWLRNCHPLPLPRCSSSSCRCKESRQWGQLERRLACGLIPHSWGCKKGFFLSGFKRRISRKNIGVKQLITKRIIFFGEKERERERQVTEREYSIIICISISFSKGGAVIIVKTLQSRKKKNYIMIQRTYTNKGKSSIKVTPTRPSSKIWEFRVWKWRVWRVWTSFLLSLLQLCASWCLEGKIKKKLKHKNPNQRCWLTTHKGW